MFTTGIQSDTDKRLYIDVTNSDGTIELHLENDFIREDDSFNNAVGVFFEDSDGNIIPNSAKCIYTHTNELWPVERLTIDVPSGASAMLYWLQPDGASYRSYTRDDILHINKIGSVPTLYSVDEGITLPSAAFANMIHTSNPNHNYLNGIFMVVDNDQKMYMEDFIIGSKHDISVIWTLPLSQCERRCADKHIEVVDIPVPSAAQKIDVQRIIPLDGAGGPDPVFLSKESNPNFTTQVNGEIWVTFVMEGAGYKNKFGYMVIDTDKIDEGPDKAIIDKVTIWENASALNSGGDLVNGDTVSLGWFPAGTTIGWWLQSNGYNDPGRFYFYSIDEWNGDKERHVAVGADPYSGKICVGFEDLWGLGDRDWNDLVFYVTGHPISTLDYTQVVIGDPTTDRTNVPVEWEESVINFDGEGQIVFNEDLYNTRLRGSN